MPELFLKIENEKCKGVVGVHMTHSPNQELHSIIQNGSKTRFLTWCVFVLVYIEFKIAYD